MSPEPSSRSISFSVMSPGCFASARTSCRDSRRWTGSKRIAPSRPFTASGSSGSSLSFQAWSALICNRDFARSRPTGTWQPACWPWPGSLTVRVRPLFRLFVVAFNLVGAIDLILDYYHAVRVGLPAVAGQLGAAYAIPVIYVPALMISHVVAFYLLTRPRPKAVWTLGREATASKSSRRSCPLFHPAFFGVSNRALSRTRVSRHSIGRRA